MSAKARIGRFAKAILSGEVALKDLPAIVAKGSRILREEIRVLRSRVVFRLDSLFSNSIVVRVSQGNGSGRRLVIWPGKAKKVYIQGLKDGEYNFQIVHTDGVIHSERKSLVAYVIPSNSKMSPELAKAMGLGYGSNDQAYSYIGGGRSSRGVCVQNFKLNIQSYQRLLKISLKSNIDRVINIDQLSISGPFRASGVTSAFFFQKIGAWILQHPEMQDAQYVLYADIDLNVSDGSSVWTSSMLQMLCANGKCILVAKQRIVTNVVFSNIIDKTNLIVISPQDIGFGATSFTVANGISVVIALDTLLPNIRRVVVRGLLAAATLHSTRQFYQRSGVYLTDFYKIIDGQVTIEPEQAYQASVAAVQAGTLLIQTPAIERRLRLATKVNFKAVELPPPVPDLLPRPIRPTVETELIRVGYAGKVTPDWGIVELLEWLSGLVAEGIRVELHIVTGKISETGSSMKATGFSDDIQSRMRAFGAILYQAMPRPDAIDLMSTMDFVWCWRPRRFEDNTLELSTKLVEMVASGTKAICFPSETNKKLLGENYSFFAETKDDFRRILNNPDIAIDDKLKARVKKQHSMSFLSKRLASEFMTTGVIIPSKICIASHDFKFIDPYVSHLKSIGHGVVRDIWGWGHPIDVKSSERLMNWADIILCEWGLENAVWYSHNVPAGKRLFVRVHLQEVNQRARKFGAKIDISKVEKVIFVQEEVRRQAIQLWHWPEKKTVVIPNFVLPDEYALVERYIGSSITLGMIGIVPQRKRLDRAVNVLSKLRHKGIDARLLIKGPRPETLAFMQAPSRAQELTYYHDIYDQIASDPLLTDRVIFEGWGNDVALWYRNVDHILSPSDFESFHYALADGVLTGCQPVVWPWDGMDKLYTADWAVADEDEACNRILTWHSMGLEERAAIIRSNRKLVAERYGDKVIFRRLSDVIDLACLPEPIPELTLPLSGYPV